MLEEYARYELNVRPERVQNRVLSAFWSGFLWDRDSWELECCRRSLGPRSGRGSSPSTAATLRPTLRPRGLLQAALPLGARRGNPGLGWALRPGLRPSGCWGLPEGAPAQAARRPAPEQPSRLPCRYPALWQRHAAVTASLPPRCSVKVPRLSGSEHKLLPKAEPPVARSSLSVHASRSVCPRAGRTARPGTALGALGGRTDGHAAGARLAGRHAQPSAGRTSVRSSRLVGRRAELPAVPRPPQGAAEPRCDLERGAAARCCGEVARAACLVIEFRFDLAN